MAITLGELAAREKARRASLTAPLYTNEDLERISLRRGTFRTVYELEPAFLEATPLPEAVAGVSAPPQEDAAKSEDEVRAEQEKAWRKRLQKANDAVARLSADVDRLQLGLNDLSQNLYGAGRRAQIARLEETKGQLIAAQQAVESVEEDGRRAGFRP
jgi:hypothetical protein